MDRRFLFVTEVTERRISNVAFEEQETSGQSIKKKLIQIKKFILGRVWSFFHSQDKSEEVGANHSQ